MNLFIMSGVNNLINIKINSYLNKRLLKWHPDLFIKLSETTLMHNKTDPISKNYN